MDENNLEAEIANAVELPKLDFQPIETYDNNSFAVFRNRYEKAFGRGCGGEFVEIIDGDRYPLGFAPTEWARVEDDRIVDYAF